MLGALAEEIVGTGGFGITGSRKLKATGGEESISQTGFNSNSSEISKVILFRRRSWNVFRGFRDPKEDLLLSLVKRT